MVRLVDALFFCLAIVVIIFLALWIAKSITLGHFSPVSYRDIFGFLIFLIVIVGRLRDTSD